MIKLVQESKMAQGLMLASMIGFLAMSCNSQEPEPEAEPDVPPAQTFEMDFSEFPQDGSPRGQEVESKVHFGVSALGILFYQTTVAVTMAIPVAAFKASIAQEPTYDREAGRWHWQFVLSGNNITEHTCNLYGQVDAGLNQVNWTMDLTKAGSYEDFTWYTGTSSFDGTSGSWAVNYDPEGNPRSFLTIDWTRDTTNDTGTIRYTLADATAANLGDYIEYGRTERTDYDAYYHVYDASANLLVEIEWNRTTHAGRVKNPNFYQDTEWHCWNDLLEDSVCPN